MQNILKRSEPISDCLWLRQTYRDSIPADCRGAYYEILNKLVAYFKELVDDIIRENGGTISLPMETDLFKNYLSGYNLIYTGFYNFWGVDGYFETDPDDNKTINIYYNTTTPLTRQRFTKTHETFHFIESLDDKFLDLFDNLLLNSTLPKGVIIKLMEKATDKATAMYLMPNEYFIKKYREIKNPKKLATLFGVSEQTLCYHLKECGITI